MAITAKDLNFTKTPDAAEALAAFLWDAAGVLEAGSDGTARVASQVRVARRAARQLFELADITGRDLDAIIGVQGPGGLAQNGQG